MTDAPKAVILTMDDAEILREAMAAYLENHGYRVLQAADGREGLEIFEAARPDLVLIDLRMPVLGGMDVLAKLRQAAPETPTIVVSGTGLLQDALEAIRLGAWDFITKPMADMAVLLHAVQKALDRARLLDENRRHREHLETEIARRTLALERSLEEKKVLLAEIHHRVKNNLQIILGLISIQAEEADSDAERERFARLETRVRSMALIHQQLYKHGDLSTIDMAEYAQALINSLVAIFRHAMAGVEVLCDCQPFQLGLDKAVPCGLLLNELVSNACKHAFDPGQTGRLTIRMTLEDGQAAIDVADDGRGPGPDFSLETAQTMGMTLIRELTRQLEGSIRRMPGPGMHLLATFPVDQASAKPAA